MNAPAAHDDEGYEIGLMGPKCVICVKYHKSWHMCVYRG